MNTKSFTLIEILVAIVILGILSTFIIISLNNVVDSANDAKRKKDLDSIAKGLMVYRNLSGTYPTGSDCDIGDGTCLDELVEAGYATTFPIDPSGSRYKYTSDGTTYTIKATLSSNQTLSYSPDAGYSQYAGLAGWSKRKSITVSNSGSSLTNYQLKFTVNRSSGTDSGFNVYVGNNCQSDYRDIRFTNSSNSVLDYWIESSDSNTATIWVEADSLPSGNTTMYLYYDNSSAVSASNGTNTFEFFDDFEGSALDTNKWTTSTGSVSVSNGSVTCSSTANATPQGIKSSNTFGTGYAIRARSQFNYSGANAAYPQIGFDAWNSNGAIDIYRDSSNSQFKGQTYNGSSSSEITTNYDSGPGGVYVIVNVKRISNSSCKMSVDNGGSETNNTLYIPSASLPVTIRPWRTNNIVCNLVCDWIFVRKYTATEPTVSNWGE